MKKNFKYILIFIFIVCLLIPISCINIFAYTWDYVNLTTSYFSTATIYSNITISGCEYITYHNSKTNSDVTITNGQVNLKLEKLSSSMAYYYINNTRCYESFNGQSYYVTLSVYSDNGFTISYNKGNTSSSYNAQYTRTDYNSGAYYNDVDKIVVYKIEIPYNAGDYARVFQVSFQLYKIHNSISFDKTYNLSFYNNDILYDSITISGASASGFAPFEEISQIKYGNTIVYDNSVWSSGYNSTLRYNQNMTMPNITQLNIDCDNIVTFYVQLYYVYSEYSQTYNIGTFYNKSQEFNSIQVNGLTIGDNKFSSINTIYYNDIKVYENNNFINSFDENLYYMYNDINISDINTACNNIVVFTKTHIKPTTDDDILYGVGNILTIIKDFANMLLLNKVTIYCCVAIPLLSFAVFIVVKLKNGNDGDNKIN